MKIFYLIAIFVFVQVVVAKRPIRIRDVKNVVCPDGSSQCPTNQTCCKVSSGGYGCCPLPKAVCCSDMLHCCPEGYKCDVSAGTCTKGMESLSLLTKTAAVKKVENVVCPDGSSQCPTNQTCCKVSSGGYGCCPLPKAVCCSDMLHCCPEGYKCDVSAGTCTKGLESLSLFTKTAAVKKVENVVCPDGSSQCLTNQTCCKVSSGGYGCCPLPKAVCCSDMLHCCPEGYKCDVSAGTCTKGMESLSLFTKTAAVKKVENVVCPDGSSQCPTNQTCCKVSSGGYGCCPLPKAVCCSDMLHCCPEGYKCDVSAGTCTKGMESLSLFTKTAAVKKVENVVCPDGSSQCPTNQTCCKVSSGGYGCCPLPKAVCCSDMLHCCPEGYKCDVSAGTCTKGMESLSLFTKTAAVKKVENVVCPDGSSQCPTNQTCCKVSSGGYGCCPLPKAVCCSDMLHCCPEGYKCDVSAGTCTKGLQKIPFLKKQGSKKMKAITPLQQSHAIL